MTFVDPSAPVPGGLSTPWFVLRPIGADDAAADHDAVMETRHQLRRWEQSSWPADDFTVEANRADLVGLAERHAAHRAFTFTVLDPAAPQCLGCVYLFPTDATFLARSTVTPVADDRWSEVDVVAYFWVRLSRMADPSMQDPGLDERLLAALRTWLTDEWQFRCPVVVTNEQFAQQVELIGRTDLTLKFRLREPGKDGTYLVYG